MVPQNEVGDEKDFKAMLKHRSLRIRAYRPLRVHDYDLWIRVGHHFRIDRINRFLANSHRYLDTKSFAH